MLFCIVLLFNYLQTFYPFKPIAKYTIPYILPIPACVAGYSTFNAYHQHFLIVKQQVFFLLFVGKNAKLSPSRLPGARALNPLVPDEIWMLIALRFYLTGASTPLSSTRV